MTYGASPPPKNQWRRFEWRERDDLCECPDSGSRSKWWSRPSLRSESTACSICEWSNVLTNNSPPNLCSDKTNRQSCLSSLLYVTRLDRQVFLANASFLENSMNTYQQVQDIPSFSYSGGDIGGWWTHGHRTFKTTGYLDSSKRSHGIKKDVWNDEPVEAILKTGQTKSHIYASYRGSHIRKLKKNPIKLNIENQSKDRANPFFT